MAYRDGIAVKAERQAQGASGSDYYICSQAKRSFGKPLSRANVRNHFISACKVLGAERLIIGHESFSKNCSKSGEFYTKHLTIHCGRHSFCSHALAGGRFKVEVKEDISSHTAGEDKRMEVLEQVVESNTKTLKSIEKSLDIQANTHRYIWLTIKSIAGAVFLAVTVKFGDIINLLK